MDTRPLIAITMGDPAGIGPEVVVKALAHPEVYEMCRPLVVGSAPILTATLQLVGGAQQVQGVASPSEVRGSPGAIEVLNPSDSDGEQVPPGNISAAAGRASMGYVVKAIELTQSGQAQAMTTAPINKEAWHLAGYQEIGHQEVLQRMSGAQEVATMLVSGRLRCVHLTTHRSLRRACDVVTRENVLSRLRLTHRFFRDWGFERPRIGVAALNPHGSEGGLLGTEEAEEIGPAVEQAQGEGIEAEGPVPADTVFNRAIAGTYDAVLVMYHDQGHIPVKVHGFERSVSVNLGLPFIRTSVDHGTAFDIAGKGIADHQSMLEAIKVAVSLCTRGRLE